GDVYKRQSQMHVSRIQRQAIKKLREALRMRKWSK
ncbi:hypothetical protein LKL48_16410, partial [Listeria monocytogenes]|nr:hypothetical protein [Listeria monocytogenes]